MGSYCWSCSARRPNERFSRKSALRGVCRECYRLGPGELAYRQAVRNIDRALHFGITIPKRQRTLVESFLAHSDPRIRAYARDVVARDRNERAAFLRLVREDEAGLEMEPVDPPRDGCAAMDGDGFDETEDIPF